MSTDKNTTAPRIRNILLPVDLRYESTWHAALPVAAGMARDHGARLRIVTVMTEVDLSLPTVRLPKNFSALRIQDAEQRLRAFVEENVPQDVPASVAVREGSIYRKILEVADEDRTDVIVMGSHRPSLSSYLLGVNAARVVRHAQCSVYVVRDPDAPPEGEE